MTGNREAHRVVSSRLRLLAMLTTAVAVGGCAATAGTARVSMPTTKSGPFVAGYHAYWAEDAWATYPLDVLDELFFFELEMGGDGLIADTHGWPSRWQAMTRRAVDVGVQVVPTLSMHDASAFQELFGVEARVGVAVETVVHLLAATPAVSGVHLDFEVFEPVSMEARDGFTAFVVELAARLRADFPRLSLSVFTLAFDDDDVYNERVLGAVADYLVVQGYDYHSAGSEAAGPVAGLGGWGRLNWANVVRRFDEFGVPRRKLVMSVPLYGYEWPVESDAPGAAVRGEGVPIPFSAPPQVLPDLPRAREQAQMHGTRRDTESRSPWYAYLAPDGWRQGWFEDATSLRAKYDFVRSQGLGGIALFPLAYGDDDLWTDLREAFGRRR